MSSREMEVKSLIPGTVSIRKTGPARWLVKQQHSGHYAHHQAVTWLGIENPGARRRIRVDIEWAEFDYMAYRKLGYLQRGRTYSLVGGDVSPTRTAYAFAAPSGSSRFGPVPWYTNEDADRFMKRIRGRLPTSEIVTVGETKEGRPLRCLVMKDAGSPRRAAVLIAREHATETAGSFAIEHVARHLIGPGRDLLQQFSFHLFPAVNPDGIANGRKLPQEAPTEVSDLHYAGLNSPDPTCKALRDYLFPLRPAILANYHGYLPPVPQIIFYDREDGMAMIDALLRRKSPKEAPMWYVKWQCRDRRTMMGPCVERFGTTLALFELPWTGRTVPEVRKLGLEMFLSALEAWRRRHGGAA